MMCLTASDDAELWEGGEKRGEAPLSLVRCRCHIASVRAAARAGRAGRQRHTAVGMTLHFCSGEGRDGETGCSGVRGILASAVLPLHVLLCVISLQVSHLSSLVVLFSGQMAKACEKAPEKPIFSIGVLLRLIVEEGGRKRRKGGGLIFCQTWNSSGCLAQAISEFARSKLGQVSAGKRWRSHVVHSVRTNQRLAGFESECDGSRAVCLLALPRRLLIESDQTTQNKDLNKRAERTPKHQNLFEKFRGRSRPNFNSRKSFKSVFMS